jgi:hypothetical protein
MQKIVVFMTIMTLNFIEFRQKIKNVMDDNHTSESSQRAVHKASQLAVQLAEQLALQLAVQLAAQLAVELPGP